MRLIRRVKNDAKDKSTYAFFVVVKPEGTGFQLESGWDTMQEAKDMVKELPRYLNPKAFGKNSLKSMGLDPKNNNHWMKG